jgi:SAM-dependent methyltransferase
LTVPRRAAKLAGHDPRPPPRSPHPDDARAGIGGAYGLAPDAPILDAGCGFSSPLALIGRQPVGIDRSEHRLRERDAPGVAADAALLPFTDGAFAAAFSFGLLHHLGHEAARRAIGEMRRVVGDRGPVAIFDGVTPERRRERPAAALIRALDRGRHMRSEALLRALFDERQGWTFARVTYAATGLEVLWCIRDGRAEGQR